jgi:hypothetical protein
MLLAIDFPILFGSSSKLMANLNFPKMKNKKEIPECVREYLSALGKKGGSVSSEAKRQSCILNGLKGVEARRKKKENSAE